MHERFAKRLHAGWCLGERLRLAQLPRDLITVGIARGGVPVAADVARILGTPLDVLIAQRVILPGHPPVSLGAVTSNGGTYLDENLIQSRGLSSQTVKPLVEAATAEARQRAREYGLHRAPLEWRGRTVLLIDDGVLHGGTMCAAIQDARKREAARTMVCVPVASFEAARCLQRHADDVIVLKTPQSLRSISEWYGEYPVCTDEEVHRILQEQQVPPAPPPARAGAGGG